LGHQTIMARHMRSIGIVICVVIALSLWVWGVNDPYVGSYNANNNYFSLAAKNYLRFGFTTLKTLPTYVTGTALPQNNEYYLHHPILFFWIVYATFLIFGFANWVVHVSSFVFALLTMVAVYFVGQELWDTRVARVATFLAFYFPMSTFFWKFVFIEQAALFFTLVVVYSFIRYIKTKNDNWKYGIGIAAFVCMLCDWYGGYLIFPFLMVLFTKFRKQTLRIVPIYVGAVAIGVSVFVGILFGTGHIADMIQAFGTRSLQTELLGLSYWWLRLPIVVVLRFIIYFTPISIVSIIFWVKSGIRKKGGLSSVMIVFFAILGLINVVVLPTASWGHGYFLYFCIPFFAYSGALFITSLKRTAWRYGIYICIILWSSIVTFSKVGQVRKQLWKFDVSTYVSSIVLPHETIGVMNYPGDVLQNYYFIDAIPFVGDDGNDWVEKNKYRDIRYVVFTCENDCNPKEREFITHASTIVDVDRYTVGVNSAWIMRNDREVGVRGSLPNEISTEIPMKENQSLPQRGFDIILSSYRGLKKMIGEVQL
jgi:4-amino-4-deoxy-L-arabinose transferase-like glycosyltransferase